MLFITEQDLYSISGGSMRVFPYRGLFTELSGDIHHEMISDIIIHEQL